MAPGSTPEARFPLRFKLRLPWWLAAIGAALAYLWLHALSLPGPEPGQHDSGQSLTRVLAGLGEWLIPTALLVIAGLGVYRSRRAHRLHDELASDPVGTALRDLGRSDFETLVAETFRREGYAVSEPLSGQPGGIGALMLTGPHGPALAHIRHWHAWRVGAAEVQALVAALAKEGIERGILVIPGEFTRDAQRLADGRPLELIDGASLRALVLAGSMQAPEPKPTPKAPSKPRRSIRVRIPWRWVFRLTGIVLAAAAIQGGFEWILSLPDKRIAPAPQPVPIQAPAGPTILVPEPVQPEAPPAPPPAQEPVAKRSVQDLETAFEAFYIQPPGCANPGSRDDLVECANHRLRAQRTYMAAHVPQEPEQVMTNEEDGAMNDADLTWDNSAAAIDALAPLDPDQIYGDAADSGYPDPYAAQSGPWEPEVGQDHDAQPDVPEPIRPSAPNAIPVPDEPRRDPEGSYIPYDPKAPWDG